MAARVLVVEDEPDILEVLNYNLQRAGYETLASQDGDEGLELARRESPDLVLLDIMLPGRSGLSVCEELKRSPATRTIPIIVVSAKGEEEDIVSGLEAGADDYVTKPFSPKVLLARVKAALRRTGEADPDGRVACRGLVILADRGEVHLDGEPLSLTATEFRLLETLGKKPGRVFTRRQLLDRAMGVTALVTERNVDVHIGSIRKKLGDRKDLIETRRGIGYRLRDR